MTLENLRVVADVPRHHAAARPDDVAFQFQGRSTTYAEVDRRASQVANGLIAAGAGPQTRVAFLGRNSDLYFEIFFGAAKANCVLVPVNWRLAPPEIRYIIQDAGAEILFVGADFIDLAADLIGALDKVRLVIAVDGGHDTWEAFPDWRDRQDTADPTLPVDERDIVIQLYTSGTTGHPKGAQLSNFNFLHFLPVGVREWGGWSPADISLVVMPIFHIAGTAWGLVGFYVGARNVIVADVDPPEILRHLKEDGINRVLFVPAVILFLLQEPGCRETPFPDLKEISYGASPIPQGLLRDAMDTFKCNFVQVYGLTETTGAITLLSPEDHDPENGKRLLSCGKPFSNTQLRIIDEAGQDLPVGEVGEVICRSTQVMAGYWNLPEATATAIRGEWFHTGDAGYLDADGYLYIHDRVKDMIISGGENIYPAEVESALFAHPGVADVAVIGVPDDRWGEAVKAIVVRAPDAKVSAEELKDFARGQIAGYKMPKTVDFIDALPRNPSGKILKRELRKPYWVGEDRQVH